MKSSSKPKVNAKPKAYSKPKASKLTYVKNDKSKYEYIFLVSDILSIEVKVPVTVPGQWLFDDRIRQVYQIVYQVIK